jgi:predicted DNA-binding transcriptional regulator
LHIFGILKLHIVRFYELDLVLVVDPGLFSLNAVEVRLDEVLILVSAAFIAILGIGAWIGYTMASTAPPKPIEEITTEAETENKTPPT